MAINQMNKHTFTVEVESTLVDEAIGWHIDEALRRMGQVIEEVDASHVTITLDGIQILNTKERA